MYGKLFEQMYDGTLSENWQALITFQQMIILCDDSGVIDLTPGAIARRTGIPIEHIEAGIEILESEDPYSRTPDENGRRIVRIDDHRPWGWRIVNHYKYRQMASYEDKKRADRERIAAKRKVDKSLTVASCSDLSQEVADVAHTYTYTDTYTNIINNVPYQDIVSYLNEKTNKQFRHTTKATKSAIKARWDEGFRLDDFKRVIDTKCAKWATDEKMVDYLRPQTLFGTKFEAYLNECPPCEKQQEKFGTSGLML